MAKNGQVYIQRFPWVRVLEHWIHAIVFILLVITGLSQKFHTFELAQKVILVFGGIDEARLVHRACGILFSGLMVLHMTVGSVGVILKRWQPTMLITKKDFLDAIDNLRYYFSLSSHPASCDRYDYKQKFEYWGVVMGGVLMVVTGFILWFPKISTTLLPGEFVPTSRAIHTNEAMLAFLIIAIWHIYNAVFSPEVFPIDTVIFTGKISRERMLHEHPIELARLEGKNLEELLKERGSHSHTFSLSKSPNEGLEKE
jgi:formate dehydrogenase gamma subunit